MSPTPLRDQHCRPVDGQPLDTDAVGANLGQLTGWRLAGDTIERTFEFEDFHHTMAFVNAVAWVAHGADHHPDLDVGYGRCTVRYTTHSVGGLSINDFICAAKVDALIP